MLRGQLEGVFVVEDGRARLRWIETGRRDGQHVEMVAGLAEGETFVITPAPTLADGDPVIPEGRSASAETSP